MPIFLRPIYNRTENFSENAADDLVYRAENGSYNADDHGSRRQYVNECPDESPRPVISPNHTVPRKEGEKVYGDAAEDEVQRIAHCCGDRLAHYGEYCPDRPENVPQHPKADPQQHRQQKQLRLAADGHKGFSFDVCKQLRQSHPFI